MVLGPKWPKNEVLGFLKKIESKDLAENGLKRSLLLLYNFWRKSHIWQKGVKMGKMAQNSPRCTKNDVFGHLKKIESKDLAENGLK